MDVKRVLQSYDRLVREVQVLEHQQELCRRMRYGLPPPEGRCRQLLEDVIHVRGLLIQAYISWAEAAAELEISESALYKKLTGERRLRPEEKDVLTRMAKRVKAGLEVE